MKKQFKFISGIDISKKTFDIAAGMNKADSTLSQSVFSNSLKGFGKLDDWIDSQGISYSDCLFCMENTGIYHRLLVSYLKSKGAFVWVESGVEIKWSLGIQRGKTDPEDARRIMTYAFRNQDKAKEHCVKDDTLQQLADCLSLRSRIQDCLKALKVPINELKSIGLMESSERLENISKRSILALEEDLKGVDENIKKLIEKHEELVQKYKLATSVKSVGFIAGVYLLVYTNGFTRFDSSKQIASFAGIAPFEYSSGTSIRGRTKVHKMGNRNLKTILHMCAVSSLRHNTEMRIYYDRKVAEGKNKMLVINAIRNKLLARVYSCVKHEKMYEERRAA